MTREELIKRRDVALQAHNEREAEKLQSAKNKKIEMDKYTVEQQMKVEAF